MRLALEIRLMRRASILVLVAVFLLAVGAVLSSTAPSRALQASPEPGTPPVAIASEVLGRARPIAVDNPELALGRVTIMPGAAIPSHHHPGTQIGVVVQGTLTYSVFTGEVAWHRASAPSAAPRMIQPGETVRVEVGDALVESPGSIHQGRNDGTVPLIIYLSTLFPEGEPRAIVAEASPSP
jgi:quercetin dioxygenase-like cupin family protein